MKWPTMAMHFPMANTAEKKAAETNSTGANHKSSEYLPENHGQPTIAEMRGEDVHFQCFR
jgi:hypothetical protein